MPVGLGFDIHRLVPGRPLKLGGVEIPHPFGLLGHSDGDVLLHALIDALLGAAGAGDIGQRYPDTDDRWKGADSAVLLTEVARDLERSHAIINVDATLILEEPKLGPHREAMIDRLSRLLGIKAAQVNLKAKTTEGMGAVGSREAVAALVVVELRAR